MKRTTLEQVEDVRARFARGETHKDIVAATMHPTRIRCPHCGEQRAESFTVWYTDAACRAVEYLPGKVHAKDSTYEHNDGIVNELWIHCKGCGRETALPSGFDIDFY